MMATNLKYTGIFFLMPNNLLVVAVDFTSTHV